MAFNWTCPHCGVLQSVVAEKHRVYSDRLFLPDQVEGWLAVELEAMGCSAPECLKQTVLVSLGKGQLVAGSWTIETNGLLFHSAIYPRGYSKPQPDYIPQVLRDDYVEACLIRDLSPKAAATLVRRCLQGMIRDFAGIQKATLYAEIDALRAAVDNKTAPETVTHDHIDAIDAVRGIGNIGAHMEKDINIIVEVDPGEAQALIELVEMLFDEWYVARKKRQDRLIAIQAMAAGKKAELEAKKDAAAAAAPPQAQP